MFRRLLYLLVPLLIPMFSALAVVDEKQATWSKVRIPFSVLFSSLYTVFKIFFPYLLGIILIRIIFLFLGKKKKIGS